MGLSRHLFFFCILHLCFFIMATLAQDTDESWLVFIPNKYKSDGTRPVVARSYSRNGTNNVQVPVNGISFALSHDFEEQKIYLSVRELGKRSIDIQRANFDGTDIETVVSMTEGKTFLAGIALDWITKNVYYADTSRWQVGVCNPISKECAALVDDQMNQPFRIALHPQSGRMFWTTRGETPGIFRASMDGSNPTRIITQGVIFPGGIAIDHTLSKLYWVDKEVETIYTADLNGANVTAIKSIGGTNIKAWHCTVSGPDIYWLDADEESIKRCNKNNGSSLTVEQRGLGKAAILFDMTFIGSGSQPNDRVNHCADDPCPHICVLTETSYRCLCPEGLTLSQDGLRCEDVGHKMLITSSGGTHLLSMTNFHMTTLANFSSSWGLSYDLRRFKVYWAGGSIGSTIYKSNLDGMDIESFVTIPGGKPITGLAYDWISDNIYYANQIHVGVCGAQGKTCIVIVHDPKNSPLRIDVFPRAGLMFYTTQGRISSITRANMDGSSARRIIRGPIFKLGFTIDKEESRLFWLQRSDNIETSDFEWRERRIIRPIRNQLVSLDVGGDLLYWMDNEMIQSCNKKTQTDLTNFKEFKWNETVFEMRLFHPEGQLQDRINHCAGGLCSHICVLTKKYFRCICPEYMNLREDARTCTARTRAAFRNQTVTPAAVAKDNGGRLGSRGNCKNWTCADGTCVELKDVCNGTLGCPDGTDEGLNCEIPCSKIRRMDEKDCIRTPNGPQILCPLGFQLSKDGTACKDVDECLENMCPHYCFNTKGSFECRDSPEGINPLTVTLAATIPTVVAIAVIGVALYFGLKYVQARKILRSLTPEEIQEFMDGDESAARTADYGAEKAMLMPFRLVIPPDSINIAKDAILGTGQFGVVYRGFHGAEAVAVKTFKRTVEIDEFKAVLAEAKIMAYIGDHENVVRFIGADVSHIAERKIIIVTELSPHGDLLGHLRKVDNGKFAEQTNGLVHDDVTQNTLVWWCEQIACGMQHLERKKIVHGDLAARNILVFKGNTLKITDFGLSIQLYGNSEYLMKRQRMLPWKWSALELLTKWEFSTDSDIWAFGVTAWEIFSLGRKPYEGLQLGAEFIHYLEQGNRLPKPAHATPRIYKILMECWNTERSSRPSFATLREFFHEEAMNTGMIKYVENQAIRQI